MAQKQLSLGWTWLHQTWKYLKNSKENWLYLTFNKCIHQVDTILYHGYYYDIYRLLVNFSDIWSFTCDLNKTLI